MCFGGGGIYFVFFFLRLFFSLNTDGLPKESGCRALFTSLIVMRPLIAYRQKSLFIPGCVQGVIILLVCLSVCLSVCVCVTFVVLTDCESCASPISTNPGSMEKAGVFGLTRRTCSDSRRL